MKIMKAHEDERPHSIIVSYVKNGKKFGYLELKVAHCIKYLSVACAAENPQVHSECHILPCSPVAVENRQNNLGSNIF